MSTIKEINEFTSKLIKAGYGDYKVYQGYDCNWAVTDVEIKYPYIRDNDILLAESDDYNDFHDESFRDMHDIFRDSFVDWAEEQYEKDSFSRQS